MDNEALKIKIEEACNWVSSKKLKPGQGISCKVKWVDWDQKLFSPAFAVLWKAKAIPEVGFFDLPSTQNSHQLYAELTKLLDVNPTWVWNFVNSCYYQDGKLDELQFKGSVKADGSQQVAITKVSQLYCYDKEVLALGQYFRQKYGANEYKFSFAQSKNCSDKKMVRDHHLVEAMRHLKEYFNLIEE